MWDIVAFHKKWVFLRNACSYKGSSSEKVAPLKQYYSSLRSSWSENVIPRSYQEAVIRKK